MIEYEIIKHDKIKDLRVFINSIRMRSLHMHHDLELLMVIEGKGTIIIKSKKYYVTKGDSLLINAFESHEIIAINDALTVIIIQFSKDIFKEYYPPLQNAYFKEILLRNEIENKDYHRFVQDILDISKEYLKADNLFELNCLRYLSDILYLIFKYLKIQKLSESEYLKIKKQNNRLDRISSYIDTHFQEPIRLSDIAQIENITTTHLSHFFTNNFGMTFQEYLKDKRLEYALRLINNQSLSLTEISERSGFSELKYMNQAFKDTFDLTPNEYRNLGFVLSSTNKKVNLSEYIYSDSESLSILNKIKLKSL